MRYSELVNAIKANTLEDLKIFLRVNCLIRISGSTRAAYLFDHYVVKIAHKGDEDHSRKEYAYYCKFLTGESKIPIVYTRAYKTMDGAFILIQERMVRVFDLFVAGSNKPYRDFYNKENNAEDIETQLRASGVPYKAFWDGLQAGYNRNNQIRFFDYTAREETW